MEAITNEVRIDSATSKVYQALSTKEGFRGWWTGDCDVDARQGGEAEFRFNQGQVAMRFRFDRLDPEKAVRMTCVGNTNNEEWQGTTLSFDLEPQGGGATEVRFRHDGWTRKSDCYNQCVGGWDHFMKSLKSYVETGTGAPF
jgi:uncharacterized protein YndB with AHSA1/START domain